MKTISYTKMREELADVLDMLRNGDDITITQRGRPDITISANKPAPSITWIGTKITSTPREASEHQREITKKLAASILNQSATKVSFQEAKNKTKIKHAGIIKALEDK
ncbi:Antitoxin of toxin-antitoxin stability system [Serratia ficaria]|uniref:type II toxin-antitoxin system Phd/YefM family antitoxin n=1 Tax=Serratia ficaria TaxID=61651 RepID=UPI0021828081|nr:type II toxin-antitoxin system prevent-host-death family antitoxin [Serratia ficaria]CAI2532397.1 Antitoxin of toxin-antitoxin stability system [Serratia ficaria]